MGEGGGGGRKEGEGDNVNVLMLAWICPLLLGSNVIQCLSMIVYRNHNKGIICVAEQMFKCVRCS